MDTVLVTGGTGHLGRGIVDRLATSGHRVRVIARHPGDDPRVEWIRGDLGTGAGVAEAARGADAIVHAATHSPSAQRGSLRLSDLRHSPTDVDIDGTRRLLAEARQSGVRHVLHISIVGVQHAAVPYSRVKAAAENLVHAGGVPWSIVAATPFYWLLDRMLTTMSRGPVWAVPSNLVIAPGDEADFADYVVECLADGPGGRRDDFGGPEALPMVEFARQFRTARGIGRGVHGIRVPRFVRRAAGPQTCPDGRHGKTTWVEWLSR
jgi:uncharacterized protein YbjT (DUF2867 family)